MMLQKAKEFSEQFGYFYLIEPLISFDEKSKVVQFWIHPDKRSKKPLHPIKNNSRFEAKKLFYCEIKTLLKKLFPTIPQPFGSSYIDLLINVRQLKKKNICRMQRNNSVPTIESPLDKLARKCIFVKDDIMQPPEIKRKVNETIL